ncbi:uncharacterized protein LOC106130412 isoform X2 [Amyelois transitella]|uniref:uncharacterized protein LOC106130412 isoform X2 n=1 Tax=Amyelois transitella TaxID=680683 RepID=UPI00298F8570|nr:uncharacterized protein LOC106130412 isoform X2 [Amyelois transitella]
MKFQVIGFLVVAVTSASALGSGPYLPSGWRPDGPAFFLPGEVQATPDNPLRDTLFQEAEAAGSSFLREYGPPKIQEVSQDITQQGLPDVATEQSFVVIEAKFNKDVVNEDIKDAEGVTEREAIVVTEAVAEQSTTAGDVVTSEAQVSVEEGTTEQSNEKELIQGRAVNLEVEASIAETTDITASVVTESGVSESEQNANIELKSTVEENLQQTDLIQQEMVNNEAQSVAEVLTGKNVEQKIVEEVKNVAQEIVKIESEIVQEANVEGSGVKSILTTGSLEQVPEGFLEYGPPGFREYGPPKGDELKTAIQEKTESQRIDNNETRRRRYSPKFRSARKH